MSQSKEFWWTAEIECEATTGGNSSSACWKCGNPTLRWVGVNVIPICRTECSSIRRTPLNSKPFPCCITGHRNICSAAELGGKHREPQLCVCPHKHPWEQKSAQPNRPPFSVLRGIVLPMALFPSPCLVPLSGSAPENFTFHLMED